MNNVVLPQKQKTHRLFCPDLRESFSSDGFSGTSCCHLGCIFSRSNWAKNTFFLLGDKLRLDLVSFLQFFRIGPCSRLKCRMFARIPLNFLTKGKQHSIEGRRRAQHGRTTMHALRPRNFKKGGQLAGYHRSKTRRQSAENKQVVLPAAFVNLQPHTFRPCSRLKRKMTGERTGQHGRKASGSPTIDCTP